MLKRLYQLLKPSNSNSPLIIQENEHNISERDISRSALRVVHQLRNDGFAAYLVGGCVRDLLLDGTPKDFDVATDATPEQVKSTFSRNARIIGRRFRIVHVRFGREIIEVTTFRGNPAEAKTKAKADHNQSEKGILLRDNVYGDIKSDALRRDFTVNALYYSPEDGTILDYAGGIEDLQKRQLRIIGDPNARYKEDPVRMLRAVRFASKLGFALTPESESPIYEHADYLADIPAARLFEEVLKLFISGSATAALTKLREYGLLKFLFPGTDTCLDSGTEYYEKLIFAMVSNTDRRLRSNKRVAPAFIYAAMLWPPLHAKIKELVDEQKLSHHDATQHASTGVISEQLSYTSIPKRFLITVREIWSLQQRLNRREGKRALQTLEHPRFRAAYDFLLLREEAGEQLDGLGLWWTRFQDVDEDERNDMIANLPQSTKKRPRRRKSSAKPKSND